MPWRVAVAVEDIAEAGQHFDLAADEQVRADLARMAGLRALPRLEASFDVTRQGSGALRVAGRVSATAGQNCVVTLEPVDNEIEEEIDLLFMPPAVELQTDGAASVDDDPWQENADRKVGQRDRRSDKLSERSWDEPEKLIGGEIDLGVLAAEFLMLGLDPYPRKPGAVFEPPQDAKSQDGPFAALARLTKGRDGA